jgi:hypothetical protein
MLEVRRNAPEAVVEPSMILSETERWFAVFNPSVCRRTCAVTN